MSDFCCQAMQYHLDAGEIGIVYVKQFREFELEYRDGGSSIQIIYYCPWCGAKLPKSVADEWFKIIEDLGLELGSPKIPQEFLTDEWWISRSL